MKYLIAALGNIGPEYRDTRHNAGFMVADYLAEEKEAAFEVQRYGDVARIKHRGRQLILLKPSTYMNLSGKAIRYWLDQEKIPLERLLVLTDDLALPLGQIRLKPRGSDGGHNGLANIQEILGTTTYPRLRLGVGSDFPRGQQVDFVLSPFEEAELPEVQKMIERAAKGVLSFATIGIDRTMNAVNKKG